MNNPILLISFLSALSLALAQGPIPIDTIYANDQKTVSLFFQDPIRQGITGSSNFAFSYNRDKEQYFGLLQATPGEESNLLVVTKNGDIYSYLLRYSTKLEKLNHFIAPSERIGNERSGSSLPEQEVKLPSSPLDTVPDTTKTTDFAKLCSQLLRNPRPLNQIKYTDRVSVSLSKSIYYGDEVYVIFEIINDSHIDFEINTLTLYRVNGNKKRKASYQELPLDPIYRFNMPEVVRKEDLVQFVLVYPKFTLSAREMLLVKLEELNGGRDVVEKLR